MPRVPTARTTTGQIAIAPLAQPERTVALANQVAGVFSQGAQLALGIAMTQRSEAIAAQAEIDDARRKHQVAEAIADITTGIGELKSQAAHDPNFEGSADRYDIGVEELLKGVSERYDPEVAEIVINRGLQLGAVSGVSVRNDERKRFTESAVESLNTMGENAIIAAAYASTPDELEIVVENYESAVIDSGVIRGEEKQERIEAFHKGVVLRKVSQLIDIADGSNDKQKALAATAAARDFVNGEAGELLEPEERTRIRRLIDAEEKDAINRLNIGMVRGLVDDIANATTFEELADSKEEVTSLLDDEVIGEERAISLDSQIRAAESSLRDVTEGDVRVEFSILRGISLERKDQNVFDEWYERKFAPGLEDMGTEERTKAKVDLVRAADLVPESIMRGFRIAENGDNSDILAAQAELYIKLRDASPQSFAPPNGGIDSRQQVFLENINDSFKAGLTVEEALVRERERQKVDRTTLSDRQKVLSEHRKEETDEDWLEGKIEAFTLNRGLFSNDIEARGIPSGMRGMFAAEVQRYYEIDPNIEKARDRALGKMGVVWGVTDFGGLPRLVHMPPEKILGITTDDVEHQFFEDVTAGHPDHGRIPEIDALLSTKGGTKFRSKKDVLNRVLLNIDPDSMREVDPRTGKLSPGYAVFLHEPGDPGSPTMLFFEDGTPVRFFPEPDSEFNTKLKEREREVRAMNKRIAENEKAPLQAAFRGQED